MAGWTDALPAIASFLDGPVGGIAAAGVEFLAEKLGASDKTAAAIQEKLAGYTPEQLVQMKQIDTDFQKFCLDNGIKLDLAQINVNAEEAKSENLFVAGWRPFVGWVCGIALAYVAIIDPIGRFIAQVGFGYHGGFPTIDTTITMQVLFGMLGLGAMRTYEKRTGVS